MLLAALTISNMVILWGGKILPQSNPKRAYITSFDFFGSSKILHSLPFFSLSHFFLTLAELGLKLKMSGLLNFQEFYTSMRLGGRGRTETDEISLFPRILHYQGVRETY